MLNLAFVFDDAVRALAGYANRLTVAPLPATVYLMQIDVINHYQYALDHYLTLELDTPFLQNSSLGTPYQKWAHFTNEDFSLLSFAVHNLLRYTSRLVHESELVALREDEQFSEMRRVSNAYTTPICEIRFRGKAIGLNVHPDHRLSITAVRTEPSTERVICRASAGGPTSYFRVIRDSDEEQPIGLDEFQQAIEVIRSESIDIADRAQLTPIRERGHAEVSILKERNRSFGQACASFYRARPVAEPFDKLNQSYWT